MTATPTSTSAIPADLAALLGTFTLGVAWIPGDNPGEWTSDPKERIALSCRGCHPPTRVATLPIGESLDDVLLIVARHVEEVHMSDEMPVPKGADVWRMCADDTTYAINWTTPIAGLAAVVHRHTCGTITATPDLITVPSDVVVAMWHEVGAKPITRDGGVQPALGRIGLCGFCLLRRRG